MSVEFFSTIDKKRGVDGNMMISSEMPAWYFQSNIRQLEDDIRRTQGRLDRGDIPHRREGETKADLRKMEKKLSELRDAMPKRDDVTVDTCAEIDKELSKTLKEVLYTRDQEAKNLVNPSKLADMMTSPCIKITDKIAAVAHANGMPVSKDGKISQNDAQRLWKLARRFNEQDTNVELLRRDK